MAEAKKFMLVPTGKKMKFTSVSIGNPFYAHGKMWVRTGREAGTELRNSGEHASSCNFTIDACDEYVGSVKYRVD